ncbi:CLUMA_CG019898, isoform A [Clunio marinus]|uniref:CLUMA_CG019898, isoform A n=1 Tax=Clunio marinus TaxID=568069 RepID=A0A1J1J1W4_9DIPT|nr:CLUMA_CG019898, isoform A [Clunio marinus]
MAQYFHTRVSIDSIAFFPTEWEFCHVIYNAKQILMKFAPLNEQEEWFGKKQLLTLALLPHKVFISTTSH